MRPFNLLKWLFTAGIAFVAGCTPVKNAGITPTQPGYTQNSLPNPLVLYNGQFAAGCGLIPSPNTLFLANFCAPPFGTYSYDVAVTINTDDTSVTPIHGHGNLVFGVSTYSQSGNTCANYAELPIVPLDSNGNTATVNLTSGVYTQAVFEAMAKGFGDVPEEIVFAVAGNSAPFTLTSSWAPCTVALGSITSVNINNPLFGIKMVSAGGVSTALPVTVYVDQLYYQ